MIPNTFDLTELYCVILVLLITYPNCYSASSNDPDQPPEATSAPAPRALSLHDPNSFSNPEEVQAEHIDINWEVDFEKKIVNGSITYQLVASNPGVKKIIFDVRDLKIYGIKDVKGNNLSYEIGEDYLTMGKPLTVVLPQLVPDSNGTFRGDVVIEYETSPNSTCLQWLTKEMTADKKFPFLYSQAQPIHARAFFPCQDTPYAISTLTVVVTAPREATVLVSAVQDKEPENVGETKRRHSFVQIVPVPSYLVAIAVGQLSSARIGPRSIVWAENSLLADAAFDFSETEEMIQAAESIVGKYEWGPYNILVLPPSFPFGDVIIAHEIAHSWTGNLVRNKNNEHLWINEGFTEFLERKILGIVRGEPERQFASLIGLKVLEETVNRLGANNPMTSLVVDLRGIDPHDSFSKIPYEKGYVFLYYLEEKVGGAASMNGFLRQYVDKFRYKSLDSNDFKNNFTEYFKACGKEDLIKDIDWDHWFYSPGMPKEKPVYDTTLYDEFSLLSKRWLSWDEDEIGQPPFSLSDLSKLSSCQIKGFLQTFINNKNQTLSIGKVKAMENIYRFSSYRNSEIRVRWLRNCIRAKWREQVPHALEFVTKVGRMEFIRPIYRDLYSWGGEVRAEAISTFKQNIPTTIYVAAHTISNDLHLNYLDLKRNTQI